MPPTSSFTATRVNKTTFVIEEDDIFHERPFIYVKIHPTVPVIVVNDTGCDAPADNADVTHLRHFIETFPVPANENKPLNPGGARPYLIILSHCHYDHIGGITQFLAGGTTQIVASAAGRDFIESDLPAHSLCKPLGIAVPKYKVTHWAQAYEKLTWPLATSMPGDDLATHESKPVDLGITAIQIPGHTPDGLAWLDRKERHLYVGDHFYEEGLHGQPIIFPPQGSFLEWISSLKKIYDIVNFYPSDDDNNDRLAASDLNDDDDDDGWVCLDEPIKIGAGHATSAADSVDLIDHLTWFVNRVFDHRHPPLHSDKRYGETFDFYRSDIEGIGGVHVLGLWCPRRLLKDTVDLLGPITYQLPASSSLRPPTAS